MRRGRWLYTLIVAGSLLWIAQSMLPLLDALYRVDVPINGPAALKMEAEERRMANEMNHRIRMSVLVLVATVAEREGQALVEHHWKSF